MPKSAFAGRRSGCPVNISLETFGDRWSLLIIRDLMVRGFRRFGEFLASGEGIASNILAARLKRLEEGGLIWSELDPADARRVYYRLTQKGIDLAPVILELYIWTAKHEYTGAPDAVVELFETQREYVLAEVRRRWHEDDATPFLPKPATAVSPKSSIKTVNPVKKVKTRSQV